MEEVCLENQEICTFKLKIRTSADRQKHASLLTQHSFGKNSHYFAPDSLEWEDLGLGYTDFLGWIMSENINTFYKDYREGWENWQQDVRNDQVKAE